MEQSEGISAETIPEYQRKFYKVLETLHDDIQKFNTQVKAENGN